MNYNIEEFADATRSLEFLSDFAGWSWKDLTPPRYELGPGERELDASLLNAATSAFGSKADVRLIIGGEKPKTELRVPRLLRLMIRRILKLPNAHQFELRTWGEYLINGSGVVMLYETGNSPKRVANILAHEANHHLVMQKWCNRKKYTHADTYRIFRAAVVAVSAAIALALFGLHIWSGSPSLIWPILIIALLRPYWLLSEYWLNPLEVRAQLFAIRHWRRFLPAAEAAIASSATR